MPELLGCRLAMSNRRPRVRAQGVGVDAEGERMIWIVLALTVVAVFWVRGLYTEPHEHDRYGWPHIIVTGDVDSPTESRAVPYYVGDPIMDPAEQAMRNLSPIGAILSSTIDRGYQRGWIAVGAPRVLVKPTIINVQRVKL